MLKVLGLQLLSAADRAANLQRAADMIRSHPGYDLYVLPELSSTGYNQACFDRLDELAEDALDGPSTRFFTEIARDANAHIAFGYPRRRSDAELAADKDKRGRYAITHSVMGSDGKLVCTYDKLHLCNMGDCSEVVQGFASPSGDGSGDPLATFECAGVRVGITICYDLRFPELFREYVWGRGCDLIIHPSAFVRDATFPTYHAFVTTRAQENGAYVLSVSYAGSNFGSSIAAPPWLGPVPGLAGEQDIELAPSVLGTEEGVLPLVVEPRTLSAVRAAYPYRADRHPTLVSRE